VNTIFELETKQVGGGGAGCLLGPARAPSHLPSRPACCPSDAAPAHPPHPRPRTPGPAPPPPSPQAALQAEIAALGGPPGGDSFAALALGAASEEEFLSALAAGAGSGGAPAGAGAPGGGAGRGEAGGAGRGVELCEQLDASVARLDLVTRLWRCINAEWACWSRASGLMMDAAGEAEFTRWCVLAYPHTVDPLGIVSAYRKEVLGLQDAALPTASGERPGAGGGAA
jgi:hypothetical protein